MHNVHIVYISVNARNIRNYLFSNSVLGPSNTNASLINISYVSDQTLQGWDLSPAGYLIIALLLVSGLVAIVGKILRNSRVQNIIPLPYHLSFDILSLTNTCNLGTQSVISNFRSLAGCSSLICPIIQMKLYTAVVDFFKCCSLPYAAVFSSKRVSLIIGN